MFSMLILFQDLTHALRSTESELNAAKSSWSPWLSKTLTSIKEVANKKDFTHFPYPQSGISGTTPTFISHISGASRRESLNESMVRGEGYDCDQHKRESLPIIKDSRSCSSLQTHN